MPVIVTPGFLANRGDFYFEMASQVEAGIPLISALHNPLATSFVRPIETLIGHIEQGGGLADSLDAMGECLPVFDRALIRAGEESGRLDQCFRVLAEYYRKRAELSKRVISFSIYPMLVVHVAIVVFPPQALVALIQGDPMAFIIQKAVIFGFLYAVGFFGLIVVTREGGHGWQSLVERVFHRVPLLGAARRNLAFSRLTLSLEALISAGVGIVQAWPTAARACGSPAIERAVEKALPKMEHGWMPSDAIREHGIFSAHFTGLYQTGEQSGRMDEALRRMHSHYQEEGYRKMEAFAFWAPNVVYGIVVLVIAWHILQFFMEYFKTISDAIG